MTHNTWIIARKELSDLVGNKWVLVVLAIYLFLVLSSVFTLNDQMSASGLSDGQLYSVMLGWSTAMITYGAIIGVMIGFASISDEKFNHALNTLVAKPVYRDSIINGKIIACIVFLLVVFGLTIALYTSSIFIVCGASSARVLAAAMSRTPIVFLIAFLYVLIFTLLSILVSILVKRQSVALLLSVLLYILISAILPTVSFAGNVYKAFGGDGYSYIINLFPDYAYGILAMQGLFSQASDAMAVISNNWASFVLFPLYIVILAFLCYVSFLRRDVS